MTISSPLKKALILSLLGVALSGVTACNTPASHNTTQGQSSPVASSTSSHPAPEQTPQICRASHLSVEQQGTQHGAGSAVTGFRIHNNGPACMLQGYPGVSLIDAAEHQLGAPATREGNGGTTTQNNNGGLLPEKATATFELRISNPYINNCAPTEVVDSQSVKIYPPNDTGWITLPFNAATCADENIETLTVSGVVLDH